MAISMSLNCCFKPSSPPLVSSPILPQRLACKDSIGIGLPSRCISIVAVCVVFGLIDATESSRVLAVDQPVISRSTGQKMLQWSDKIRECPPWRLNSLENVMPENLPRLSDRQRTDGFVSAPAIGGQIRFNKSCFSL